MDRSDTKLEFIAKMQYVRKVKNSFNYKQCKLRRVKRFGCKKGQSKCSMCSMANKSGRKERKCADSRLVVDDYKIYYQ
jgi:hypothetical protein